MRHGFIFIAAAALLLAGCVSPISVKEVDARQVHRALTANVLSTGEPSPFSVQVLQRTGLAKRFERDPAAALTALHELTHESGRTEELFALAELSFLHGERSDDRRYTLAAAIYAYAYLFPENDPGPDRLDPRLRTAADLYNRALTRALAVGDGPKMRLASGIHPLPFGQLTVEFDEAQLWWAGHRLEDFVSVADFEVRGLAPRYRDPGIGAPLAARMSTEGTPSSGERRVAPRMRIPSNAFLRVETPRRSLLAGDLRATLEFHTADEVAEIEVAGQRVLLEYETTSSLAYMLSGSRIWELGRRGFMGGDFRTYEDRLEDGLVMLRPYRPGLVPLVFVHGTLSSPATWAVMLNELMHDPAIYNRYQLWFFFYNTGNPILYSASQLRTALHDAVADLDPDGEDPAMREMVVVGHSQGGILARMIVSASEDHFWRLASDAHLDDLEMKPETRALLRRSFFFDPVESVRSAIFIATPHSGSFVAGWRLARLGASSTKPPRELARGISDVLEQNPDRFAVRKLDDLPNSVDNMTPGHPFLVALEKCPIGEGVTAHSIIAVMGDGPPEPGNDGMVAYESAHIEWAASEKVIRSGHSTLENPHTINEVRRILGENLETD